MSKLFGILLILLSAVLVLWSAIGILGTIEGLASGLPSEGRVWFIQLGKLLLVFPVIGYVGFKAFNKGRSKFNSD